MKRILFFFLAFAAAVQAQTAVGGQSEVLGAGTGTVVSGLPARGSVAEGQSILLGGTILDYHSAPGAQIFAIFPPSYSSVPTTDYYYFVHDVLTNPSIDGVNIKIVWSKIEPPTCGAGCTSPSTMPLGMCASYSLTGDTQYCVKDAANFYHNYSWNFYEGSGCYTANNIQVWFGLCPTDFSMKKIVNLYFIGIDAGMNNTSTPEYVTDPSYYTSFTPSVQDAMNSINGSACGLQQWVGYTGFAFTLSVSGTTLTSTAAVPNPSWQNGDMLWVTGSPGGNCDVATKSGAPITIYTGGIFSYPAPPTCGSSFSGATVIGAVDSYPVPYEQPYTTAYRAALTALFLHFNVDYQPPPAASAVSSQLGYIRFGQSVGGEAYPYCPTFMESLNYPLLGGGVAANWPCDWTGFTAADALAECAINVMNGDAPNPGYYGASLQWAQSKSPYMRIYAPLNEFSGDISYSTREAEQATTFGGSNGNLIGFGSQGATLADTNAGLNGCANSTSNWCSLFGAYHGTGAPLELQQAGLSDPLDSTCEPPLSIGSSGCAAVPQGDCGDLRIWLPFEVANYASVIELHYLDAALAFDPNCCTYPLAADGLTCLTGYDIHGNPSYSYVSQTMQGQFYATVGQGTNCPPGTGGGTLAGGNCSYAAAIMAAHKPH